MEHKLRRLGRVKRSILAANRHIVQSLIDIRELLRIYLHLVPRGGFLLAEGRCRKELVFIELIHFFHKVLLARPIVQGLFDFEP